MMGWRTLRKALEEQGFVISETKKGFLIRSPNGHVDSIHRDPSDASLMKVISRLKNRGGFVVRENLRRETDR